jgi:hypothetical protein
VGLLFMIWAIFEGQASARRKPIYADDLDIQFLDGYIFMIFNSLKNYFGAISLISILKYLPSVFGGSDKLLP